MLIHLSFTKNLHVKMQFNIISIEQKSKLNWKIVCKYV